MRKIYKEKGVNKASNIIAESKKYTIIVGIDRPGVRGDDVFEIELDLFRCL